MTPFTKQNLTRQGNLIIFQQGENTDRKIVARFKYQKGSIATFMTHLRKNWTAEDYFAKESTGLAPLQIVEEYRDRLPVMLRTLSASKLFVQLLL